jgi:hypothetical protein
MTDPPSLDLLTMGRLFTVELPDARGPVTVLADHVRTNADVLLDPRNGQPMGQLWHVDMVCSDAEGLAVRLGMIAAGRSLHTSNGWAVVYRVDARLSWWLDRAAGGWRAHRAGTLGLELLYPHARP